MWCCSGSGPLTIVTRRAGSATLNLLISLAAQPLVLVSVSLTALDDELKRMRAPRDTAPAAAARAISADAPTQAELFT